MLESSVIPPKPTPNYKEMAVLPPRKLGESPEPIEEPKNDESTKESNTNEREQSESNSGPK